MNTTGPHFEKASERRAYHFELKMQNERDERELRRMMDREAANRRRLLKAMEREMVILSYNTQG